MSVPTDDEDTKDEFDELETSVDSPPTRQHADVGVIAELRTRLPRGPEAIALYRLPDHIVVGRGTACDWQLDDHSLSRRHAVFHWDGQLLEVEDLGSANGTRIGGQLIHGRASVTRGGTVELGAVSIEFADPSPERQAATEDNPDYLDTQSVKLPEYRSRPTSIARAAAAMPTPPAVPQAKRGMTSHPPPLPAHIAPTPSALSAKAPPLIAPVPRPAFPSTMERRTPASEPPPRLDEPTAENVFRPAFHVAGPNDVTQLWDPEVAARRPQERLLGGLTLTTLRQGLLQQWQTNRRLVLLGGATLVLTIMLVIVLVRGGPSPALNEGDDLPTAAARRSKAAPTVTSLVPTSLPSGISSTDAGTTPDQDALLAEAIAAYDQGKVDQALVAFQRLALARPEDPGPRYMVDLLESQRAGR